MREAAAVVDATYTTPVESSAPMEPHASVAQWDGDRLTLHGAYQMLKFNRNEIADALGIPAENVRILAPYMGGNFGSKLGICHDAVAAAVAARALGRPVRVVLGRQSVFEATMRRSETVQRVRLAAKADGTLRGLAHEVRVSTRARVTLDPDGTALVETDMTDIGTGTYTILGQIAAEMLGVETDKVTVTLGDTDLPPGPGSGGSWGAQSSGSSVYLACEAIRTVVARRLGCERDELTLKDGTATGGNNRKPFSALLDEPIVEEGHIEPGKTMREVSQAGYGAHFAEVAVNAVTGETRVRRMLGAFAAGRVLNPQTARSQCHGGMIWGIGAALMEELHHDPRDGHVVNRDLAEYHIPVNLDAPQIDVIFVDERDDHANPSQAKGIGELGISGAGAAVTNAIFNACGVRVRDYPATLDKVLAHLPE